MSYEKQGTGYDRDAVGYERQGRDNAPDANQPSASAVTISDEMVEAALGRWFIAEDISDCTEEMHQQFRSDMRAALQEAMKVAETPSVRCYHPACMCMIKCDEIQDNVVYVTKAAPERQGMESAPQDAEIFRWLETQAKESRTGISFDWVPTCEGDPSGWRFMRRHFISAPHKTLRQAIRSAMDYNLGRAFK